MSSKSLLRRAWTDKKCPLISEKFTAEVQLDGPKAIPLQELANRHRAEGYMVKEKFFTKDIGNKFAPNKVPFMRVTIERGQLDMERDV